MADTPLTDDYVAELLIRDASRTDQNRFVTSGLGSRLSRPRSNVPRPNTRFLRNIVRDADTHNAALRKKEEDESRVRLRRLERVEGAKKDRERSPGGRRREREGFNPREKDSRRNRDGYRSRDLPRERRRSRSPRRGKDVPRQERRKQHRSQDRGGKPSKDDYDSDELETIIGPRPPPVIHSRGRGANNGSAMDSRFHPHYDPKQDVSLDAYEEDDDWDMALEALRDRAKWRKSGAERLRAAGFTENEVMKWESGCGGRDDGEKDIADVKWKKKGEGREWDRGKVVDGGRLDVKAAWAGTKNT